MNEEIQIDIIDTPVCYCKVYEEYLVKNKPFLLSNVFSGSWLCRDIWVDAVDNRKPNWDFMRKHFGQSVVPVANCDEKYYNAHSKSDWILNDYLDYLVKYKAEGYPSSMPCLYLKDWHFVQNLKADPVYETPCYFAVDWLNEHWMSGKEDDYRFVYIGPKNSWTPFHTDVYGSFSWSANIIGKKRWLIFPPGEEGKLRNIDKSLPNDLSEIDLKASNARFIDLIQNEGEILFVPSGWHHQVWNLEDTISINHNWFNGANIHLVYSALVKASEEIQAELRGFSVTNVDPDQLETILQCHHGMNFGGIKQLLQTVVERRDKGLLRVHSSTNICTCDSSKMCNEEHHISNDRKIALELLNMLHDLPK